MINRAVLVLNQNYEPLNVCHARRAFVLIDRGKAEVLSTAMATSARLDSSSPSPLSSA